MPAHSGAAVNSSALVNSSGPVDSTGPANSRGPVSWNGPGAYGRGAGSGESVDVVGVTKSFGAKPALSDVHLHIDPGTFLVLLGHLGWSTCGCSARRRASP